MAKRSRPFTDEASKYTGASSKSKLAGKRILALAAVRHEKSSLLFPAGFASVSVLVSLCCFGSGDGGLCE